MNYSKIEVQELNTHELKNIEGGLIMALIIAAYGTALVLGVAYSAAAGFKAGLEATQ